MTAPARPAADLPSLLPSYPAVPVHPKPGHESRFSGQCRHRGQPLVDFPEVVEVLYPRTTKAVEATKIQRLMGVVPGGTACPLGAGRVIERIDAGELSAV